MRVSRLATGCAAAALLLAGTGTTTAQRLERYLDSTLVFGVPLLSFGFQLRLMGKQAPRHRQPVSRRLMWPGSGHGGRAPR